MGCGGSTSIKVADESAIGDQTVVPKSTDVVVQPESGQSIVPVPSAPDIVITQTDRALEPQETARSPSPSPSPEPPSPHISRLRVPSISTASNEARYHENSTEQGENSNDASPDRPAGFSSASSRDASPSSPSSPRHASRRSGQSVMIRSHSKTSVISGGSRGSHLSVPQSGEAWRPPSADQSSQPSSSGERDAVAELLGKEVLHSGSLMQETIRVRALQGCETLSEAIQALPKPDQHMPNFDVKVDPENMLLKLPHDIFRPNQLSLQRVSFMGTKWIALRLCVGSREQCMKFCMVAASLQNLGRNTSRSVVVEACSASPPNGSEVCLDIPGFVCAPIPRDALISTTVSWLEIWQDVIELTEIFLNEASLAEKKVTAELKKWTLKVGQRSQDGGGQKRRFSFLSAITGPTAPSSPKLMLKRRAMSESHISESESTERLRDRSHSEADLEAGQPAGALSSMAKWVKRRVSLNGVFSSLEDQLASLTPPPEPSSSRALRRNSSGSLNSPRGRDEIGESRKSSKSSTSSNGRRRTSHTSSCSETDTGPESRRNSVSSSASRRRSCSWPGPLPEDDADYSDSASAASLPSSSSVNGAEPEPSSPLSRRKSFSQVQMMPVLHEGAQDLSEKNSEDEDEDDDQEAPPPKMIEDEDDREAPPPQVVEDKDDEQEAPPPNT